MHALILARRTLALLGALAAVPASAQDLPPSLRDSFRLGSGGGVLCQVQTRGHDPVATGMFDRAWSVVCRDAARPIGKLYALRGTPDAVAQRLAAARAGEARCPVAASTPVDDLPGMTRLDCSLVDANVTYHVFARSDRGTVWVAEGLGGYDDALKLGLRTIEADRIVDGTIEVATISIPDPVAFARAQAGSLDPEQALAEGYRRNNAGDYAEAAEFFGTLQQRAGDNADRTGEYLINQALQKSNLGAFAEADRLFTEAARIPTTDRVQIRLRRNFEAMHLLNQQQLELAIEALDRPVTPLPDSMRVIGGAIEIGQQVAAEINSGQPVAQQLGTTEAGTLTPEERSVILDAQALALRGTILRLQAKPGEARTVLNQASAQASSVRGGRVVSIIRLRAQIIAEIAAAWEAEGDFGRADAAYRSSIALLEQRYPETVVLNSARARLAAFLARRGRPAEAMTLYKGVVDSATRAGLATTGMTNLLAPYFALLVDQSAAQPALVDDFFVATQTLIRPGVADTQAQLSRELSEGSGEAATLFRAATALRRDVERTRVELATARAAEQQTEATAAQIAALQRDLDRLERDQSIKQAELGKFAQYRALSTDSISLADLRAALRPDEAYLKLATVGPAVYALYATSGDARAYRLSIGTDEMAAMVDDLRATISVDEGGELVTYPFDLALSRKLYVALAGPVADRIAAARYLVFEPDGAMLRLPVNLLVTEQAGVDAYAARTKVSGADKFDFSGVSWLGRSAAVSTAVSARGFRDARAAPRSAGKRDYLGFGQNALAEGVRPAAIGIVSADDAADCQWPLSEWNKPIAATELHRAQAILGAGDSDVVTGRAFTDQAVIGRADLANYRILHFATHGFVTAPKPACPARPALLTSFGGAGSDGLLSFREIYDLHIDADLVILSACDTAGRASVAATREAGVTSGGGSALDGLVRAFIGAGGRSVLASHWPAPDEFQATERLISGVFEAPAGTTVADALKAAEIKLMDDPKTSHPFYWSGFAIIGDGAQPLIHAR